MEFWQWPSRSSPKRRQHVVNQHHRGKKPEKYIACECYECLAHPSIHPTLGLAPRGSWIRERDFKVHDARQRNYEVASSWLPSTAQSRGSTSSPDQSQHASPTQLSRSPSLSPPRSPPPSPPRSPSPSPSISQVSDQMLIELNECLHLIRPASETLGDTGFQFLHRPKPTQSHLLSSLTTLVIDQLCRLDPSAPTNSKAIELEEILRRVTHFANNHLSTSALSGGTSRTRLTARTVLKKATTEEENLRSLKFSQWTVQQNAISEAGAVDTAKYYLDSVHRLPPVLIVSYLIASTLHLLSGLSMDHCTFLLLGLKLILESMAETSTSILTSHSIRSIPSDPRRVIDILDLKTPSTIFTCCPSCSYLYPNTGETERCSNNIDGEVCNTRLLKKRGKARKKEGPIRRFACQTMEEYLSRLYSRPELQEYLYKDPRPPLKTEDAEIHDIWDAPFLREFKGPDNRIFVDPPDRSSHLVFSLNMDGLNPYGSRQSGKKLSVGAIYMICLNLPASIRYDLENIFFVGVIPGPGTPTGHEINYFLRPLVDELLALWHTGIYLTRTARHLHGCRVRCALIPLVCDLPAARQMSGISNFQANLFCSLCFLERGNINQLNTEKWKKRDPLAHRDAAQRWKDSTDDEAKERIEEEEGARWSELLRLPYYDPINFTVIDSMHAFFLRLFQYHCRDIWGMSVTLDDGIGITVNPAKEPKPEQVREGMYTMRHGSSGSLGALSPRILSAICKDLGVDHRGKKKALLSRLLTYRDEQDWEFKGDEFPGRRIFSKADADSYFENALKAELAKLNLDDLRAIHRHCVPTGSDDISTLSHKVLLRDVEKARGRRNLPIRPPPRKATRVLGKGVLREVRKDMKRLFQPSWAPRAPSHPGEAKWGKFSADQWRSFCTYNLPITLIRLWGSKAKESRERRQLDNFMHLVTAVKLANMRSMSSARVDLYEKHIKKYLETLLELYPEHTMTPYQHLALHFGQFLRNFGPTHAWRCFPFERYNYVLQNIPTNQKWGELEVTMFDKFCAAQNIRAFVAAASSISGILARLVDVFNKTFRKDIRGTLLGDSLGYDPYFKKQEEHIDWNVSNSTPLLKDTHTLLSYWVSLHDPGARIPRQAYIRERVSRLGENYCGIRAADDAVNDSHVMYADGSTSWQAGSIMSIFTHTRHPREGPSVTQTFAVVAPYVPLSGEDADRDPYRRYPQHTGGSLYQNELKPDIIVAFDDVKCHFASVVVKMEGISGECLLSLPLDKS